MQIRFNHELLNKVTFLIGNACAVKTLESVPMKTPFADDIIEFLDEVSRELMRSKNAKAYSDVITFAFWIRKASTIKLKERFNVRDGQVHLGKGVIFHVAPSNVPTNFAYSLTTGLLCGNANVVRVPSRDFVQVKIITEAIRCVMEKKRTISPYIICVRYDKNKEINDFFSSICEMRIVWGGNQTISEIRKSPLPPRSGEITFADRYSVAVIDSNAYLQMENKDKIAEDFFNDTFFSDQNACTSPRLIIWMGNSVSEAMKIFWKKEHELVKKKYKYQSIQGINKLTTSCMAAAALEEVKVVPHEDNLIVRIEIKELTEKLMDYKENSGFFYEYICEDILKLIPIFSDKHCQTIGYIGEKAMFNSLLEKGLKGVDRIVPIGKTMDYDLLWDGYQLPFMLSRTIVLR